MLASEFGNGTYVPKYYRPYGKSSHYLYGFLEGMVGFLRDPTVVQIIDDRNVLVTVWQPKPRYSPPPDPTVWVTGHDTRRLVDGERIMDLEPVEVVGPKRYSAQTVWQVRCVPLPQEFVAETTAVPPTQPSTTDRHLPSAR